MTTILHIKTDKKIRDQVQKLAKNNGMTITTLVNISLRNLINKPILEIDLQPELNAKTKKLIAEARRDYKNGKNISGPFKTVEELMAHLNK
jgi:addiction module RelB/DinJ family antitoxin